MDGIVIGRSPTSNALLVYNPQNKQYYEPDSYRLDSYRLPTSVYPDIKYNGSLFCSLVCDNNPTMEEKYLPGTCIERIDPATNMLLARTVMNIPFLMTESNSGGPVHNSSYSILLDNGTSALIPLSDMANLIPPPPVVSTPHPSSTSLDSLLPPFLRLNSRITYKHDNQYHKGFLVQRDDVYCFVFKSHVNKRKEDWRVDLPNLAHNWVDLCVEGVLIPGHVLHSFLHPPGSPSSSTYDPVASFVSAVNLQKDCPPSLLTALANFHPDREVWLQSYYKEKLLEEEVPTELKVLLTLSCTLTSLSKHTTEDPAPGYLSRRRIAKMIYFKL